MFSSRWLRTRRKYGGGVKKTDNHVQHEALRLKNVDTNLKTDTVSNLLWKAKMVKAIGNLDTTEVERLLSDEMYETLCHRPISVTHKIRNTSQIQNAMAKDELNKFTFWYKLLNEPLPIISEIYQEAWYTNILLFTVERAAEIAMIEATQNTGKELRTKESAGGGSRPVSKSHLAKANPEQHKPVTNSPPHATPDAASSRGKIEEAIGPPIDPLPEPDKASSHGKIDEAIVGLPDLRLREIVDRMNTIVRMLIENGATDHNTFRAEGEFRNALHVALEWKLVSTIGILITPVSFVDRDVRYAYFFRAIGKDKQTKKPYNVLMRVKQLNIPAITLTFQNLGYGSAIENDESVVYDKKAKLSSRFEPAERQKDVLRKRLFRRHGNAHQNIKNYPFPTPEQFNARIEKMAKKWLKRLGAEPRRDKHMEVWRVKSLNTIARYGEALLEIFYSDEIKLKREKLEAFDKLLHEPGELKDDIEKALDIAHIDLRELTQEEQAEYLYIWNIKEPRETKEKKKKSVDPPL